MCDPSSFVLLSQAYFSYSGSFVVPYEFLDFFSVSVKNAIGILIGIALNLYMALSTVDILTVLILLIHDQDICPFICVFSFLLSKCYSFQYTYLSQHWLNLFLCILLLLMLL